MFKKSLITAVTAFGAMMMFSCGNYDSKEENGQTVNEISFQKIQIEFKDGTCHLDSLPGLRFSAKYAIPIDSTSSSKTISNFVEDFIVRSIRSNTDSAFIGKNTTSESKVKNAYEDLKASYYEYRKSYPDAQGCWEIEIDGDTIFTNRKLVSYGLAQYSYLGGAHPNTFTTFYLFDAQTGQETNPLTFITDSTQFLTLVEKTFRKVENLTPKSNLENEGYFLENGKFFLPANYTFCDKGILLHYNAYEIAPYVKGPISFTIPYSELKGLIKEELIF